MIQTQFFQKKRSAKVNAGGPTPQEQLLAMAEDRYWVVLNTNLLRTIGGDKVLIDRVNAFKHALQTYGPSPQQGLPDLRQNTDKAKGHVFHGHVTNSNGTTFILEWTSIDRKNRIMALLGFDTHENYKFQKEPLTIEQSSKILAHPDNVKILNYIPLKIKEAKDKVDATLGTKLGIKF